MPDECCLSAGIGGALSRDLHCFVACIEKHIDQFRQVQIRWRLIPIHLVVDERLTERNPHTTLPPSFQPDNVPELAPVGRRIGDRCHTRLKFRAGCSKCIRPSRN
jgi:hypothetical protein